MFRFTAVLLFVLGIIDGGLAGLSLGLHYTSSQGGDRTVDIADSTGNLADVGFDNGMSRYKIDGEEIWAFYSGVNFDGLLFTATGPLDWTRVDSQFNDQLSSVKKLGSILSLGLHYTEQQGGDRTVQIMDATENLSENGFNNAMSRYKIEGNEVWGFYRGANFEDLIFTATGPLDWTRVDSQFNDQVSSVKVISPLSLGLHYTAQQGGDRTIEIKGPANLADEGFNNAMSRYKISGKETWGFYRGANFDDLIFTATGPIDWTRVDAQYNDQVSSVKPM